MSCARFLVPLLAFAGCDLLFDLHSIDPVSGDGGSGSGSDVPAPDAAFGCGPTHDEDGDHIQDGGDLCPTVTSTGGDGDQDEVGDECDPHNGALDAIAAFFPLCSLEGLDGNTGITQLGDAFSISDGGTQTAGVLDMIEKANLGLANLSAAPVGTTISLSAGMALQTVRCNLSVGPCTSTQSKFCLMAHYLTMTTQLAVTTNADQIVGLELDANGTSVTCGVTVMGGTTMLAPTITGTRPAGVVAVQVGGGPVTATNLIVYRSP